MGKVAGDGVVSLEDASKQRPAVKGDKADQTEPRVGLEVRSSKGRKMGQHNKKRERKKKRPE